ncbi:MAG: TonB-dependent receptor plug domain-containing protein [Campylobacteraceae bacterium]|nr:TonB-dependent receptor plug domain-containing protein [Campylobacteraceae bacterium]
MILSKIKTVFVFSLIVCVNLYSQANTENNNETSDEVELQKITVKTFKETIIGGTTSDNQKITSIPTPANSITDTLRQNSNIQFSSNSRSSSTGGEIAPPRVSIRGSQHYENNFMINGVSNNNNLNPGGVDASVWNSMSGEAQSIFLDTSLVESITARTEAISAEYGGFTGGVIDAKLKNARMDKWHFMTKYRYTANGLAKYHLTDEQKSTNQSTDVSYQPEFNKYEYAISLDGPINDNLGLMLSYGKQHSKIPLWSAYDINRSSTTTYKERRVQYRNNENYLIKLDTHDIDNFEASLSAVYAPYVSSMFFPEARYSDFDQKGGGYNIAYDMKNVLSFGLLKNTLAYKQDEFSANGDTNYYYMWQPTLGYANWNRVGGWGAREGNTGYQKFLEKTVVYKGVLDFDEIDTGLFTHLIKAGIEAEFGKAKYKREESYYFTYPQLDNSVTGSKENGIITGEQWANTLYLYGAIDNKKSYITTTLFFEDSIGIDRFTLRPGVRISTDTVTDNTDIAPRLFVNADIFNDKTLNVYGGYNRYYGGLLLYNSIYELHHIVYRRSAPDDPWAEIFIPGWGGKQDYSLDGIKTPYSDEFSVGSSLNYQDTLFKLDFVKREYKDQIKQKREDLGNGLSSFKNTNDGKSSYWGLSLAASKEYKLGNTKHFSELSAVNSKSKTNMSGLDSFSQAEAGYSLTYVTYDGKLTKLEDVPAANYNSPWIITYTHIAELNDYLKLGLNARYEKGVHGFKFVDNLGSKDPDGLNTRNYASKDYGDIFTIDLSANCDLKIGGNKLTFGLEVLNILNRKNDASYAQGSSNIDGYAMGRQFYANFKYEY